jgi:hypothetical protein
MLRGFEEGKEACNMRHTRQTYDYLAVLWEPHHGCCRNRSSGTDLSLQLTVSATTIPFMILDCNVLHLSPALSSHSLTTLSSKRETFSIAHLIIQNYRVFLLRSSSGFLKTTEHSVSKPGSVSVIR